MPVNNVGKELKYFNKLQERLTKEEWKKIRQLLATAENDIIQKLRGYDLSDWQIFNLRRIQGNLNETINRFDTLFKESLVNADIKLIDTGLDKANKIAFETGMKLPTELYLRKETIEIISAMSEAIAENFTGSMRKIINSEVSLGIVSGKSVSEVAGSIKDKFGLDSKQRDYYEGRKSVLERDYSKGLITKETYDKKTAFINSQLAKGSEMSYARAERIAQTEMLTSASMAEFKRSMEIAENNKDAVKMWISTHKPGARESHIEAEERYRSNPIPVDEPFVIGEDNESCMFPRDPALSAKERVNCACYMVTVSRDQVDMLKQKEII